MKASDLSGKPFMCEGGMCMWLEITPRYRRVINWFLIFGVHKDYVPYVVSSNNK